MPPIAPALPTLRGITHYRPRNTMTFDHSLPRGGLTRPETGLLLGAAVLLALAVLGPAVLKVLIRMLPERHPMRLEPGGSGRFRDM